MASALQIVPRQLAVAVRSSEMGSNDPHTGMQPDRPHAALTPRPVRLLLVGKVRPGREGAVREEQTRFPIDAAAENGVDAIEAFIGSGFYALVIESSSKDMQQTLTSCLSDERIKAFFAALAPHVEGLPGPEWSLVPGDRFHLYGAPGSSTSDGSESALGTAALPLAANMYRWRIGQQPEIGDEPHRGEN
jgi:hypothetical protein